MARENGQGAVDLFGEDGAGQLVGQRDGSQREHRGCTSAGGVRPSIGRANGEDQRLCTAIAQATDLRGELLAGQLPASAVEQDQIRRSARGLAIQPSQQRSLRIQMQRLRRGVSRSAGEIIGGKLSGSVRLRTGAGWRHSSKDKFHTISVLQSR